MHEISVEFNQLVIRNTDFLKLFAARLTSDAETAKDLLQETFFKAFANKEKYSFGSNIKAWLYTIMRNIFINDYRKNVKHDVVVVQTENEFVIGNSQLSVVENAESRLKVKEVQAAIYNLPVIFRNPFLLYLDGYKYYEIARLLKEPLGTIKSRIHFARKLLKSGVSRYN
jgi:RNA polymerase sigma-70 factor (ECF subfamily)